MMAMIVSVPYNAVIIAHEKCQPLLISQFLRYY